MLSQSASSWQERSAKKDEFRGDIGLVDRDPYLDKEATPNADRLDVGVVLLPTRRYDLQREDTLWGVLNRTKLEVSWLDITVCLGKF